jgi:NitT/TauT family transport system substrate-binding protein
VVASVPTGDAAGLFIAEQRGFFAAHGLSVKIVPVISGADAISNQLSGKYDITFGNYVSYIQAAQQGAPLHVLAAGSVMGPAVQMIMVGPDSPITGVQQLVGRKVAVNVTGNIGTLLIDSVLTAAAVPATSNVTQVPMPFPKMAEALASGKVDAAWMPEPFVTQAEETIGAQPLADANAGLTQNLPIGGYIVTNSWMQKNPRTAAAFVAALNEGQQVATTNSVAVEKALVTYAHVPAGTAAIVQSPVFPQHLDAASIQRIADLMLKYNLIPHGFSTSTMTG